MKRTITTKWLREQGACSEQVAKFEKEWGASARLTKTNLYRAKKLNLDLDWLVGKILSGEAREWYRESQRILLDACTELQGICICGELDPTLLWHAIQIQRTQEKDNPNA